MADKKENTGPEEHTLSDAPITETPDGSPAPENVTEQVITPDTGKEHDPSVTVIDLGEARRAMNDILAGSKLPKMEDLKKLRHELADKKKALYAEYRESQRIMREAVAVKTNIDHLIGVTGGQENKGQKR